MNILKEIINRPRMRVLWIEPLDNDMKKTVQTLRTILPYPINNNVCDILSIDKLTSQILVSTSLRLKKYIRRLHAIDTLIIIDRYNMQPTALNILGPNFISLLKNKNPNIQINIYSDSLILGIDTKPKTLNKTWHCGEPLLIHIEGQYEFESLHLGKAIQKSLREKPCFEKNDEGTFYCRKCNRVRGFGFVHDSYVNL